MFRRYFSAKIVPIAGRAISRNVLTVLSLSATLVLSLFAGIALAEPPKLISYGVFPARAPSPVGVAVDQSSGDVYVAGLLVFGTFGPSNIDKFDTSGKVLPPSPFGGGSYSNTAVNPTNGEVYVLGKTEVFSGPVTVDTFDPGSGAVLSTPFEVPPSNNLGFATAVQIAADSAGNVYVPVAPNNEVLEYSPTGTLLKTFTGTGGSVLKGPTGVAVDSLGNLWVADTGNNRIEELSPADVPLGEIKSEGVEDAIALDGHGDVFVIVKNSAAFCGSLAPPCSHLVEYGSTGAQLADVGAGSLEAGGGFRLPPMVAVNDGSGRVYVSDASGEEIWVFGPPTAPIVGSELSAEVQTSEGKLGALVNPGGIETSYRFEYGTTTAYGASAPSPEGSVGEGVISRTVWAAASHLAPGTTYHYRVIATNELGTIAGVDQTFTTETSEQAACPNEQLRGGYSAALPDCRAYELVTPPPKNSSQVRGLGGPAADGNAYSFGTEEPLPGASTGGKAYVAARGADGWGSEAILPQDSYTGILCSNHSSELSAYSDELSKALVAHGLQSRASIEEEGANYESCNANGLQVVAGEPVGYANLLVRDNATGAYLLLNAPPPGVAPADAHFKGASLDLSHVVFSEKAPLTPNAPHSLEDLYEWGEGALRLLTMLPDGATASGSLAEGLTLAHAISADGSHILFTSAGRLYDRIDGGRTVQVDEAQGGPGASGGGAFQAASADGSTVFFLDTSRLTADSTAESGEPDLYQCVLPEGASKCELTDLTVAKAGEHADVLQVSVLGRTDTSHVYFTAKGLLASNTREYTDARGKQLVEGAQSGETNLYFDQGGTITFIATLAEGEVGTGAVSPDGTWFAFESRKSLTGYENTDSLGHAAQEIFLYSAVSHELVCASCNPSGEAVSAGGAQLPTLTSRPLADGGRLFFDTNEELVPSDTNGNRDVYEYEGSRLSLISSGTSSGDSLFTGASESGDDAFFASVQALVPPDTGQEAHQVYDARVGGGFPSIASPPSCTTADACRTPVSPQPSIYGAPSSQMPSGSGDLAPLAAPPPTKPKSKSLKCKHGFVVKKVKGKNRCVRKQAHKAHRAHRARHTNKRGK